MSKTSKFSELNPHFAEMSIETLKGILIKTIPGLIADKNVEYRRGMKIRKKWFTKVEDIDIDKPAFCKEYSYEFKDDGEVVIHTRCIWFDTDDEILDDEYFHKLYSKSRTRALLEDFRKVLISRLKSDAEEIPGLNGKAVEIFIKYKDSIQLFYEFASAAQTWIDEMDNETDPTILALLGIKLPTLWLNDIYETAVDGKQLFRLCVKYAGINPITSDGLSIKSKQILAGELFGKGLDITSTNQQIVLGNMIAFLIGKSVDIRMLTIKDIIINVTTT